MKLSNECLENYYQWMGKDPENTYRPDSSRDLQNKNNQSIRYLGKFEVHQDDKIISSKQEKKIAERVESIKSEWIEKYEENVKEDDDLSDKMNYNVQEKKSSGGLGKLEPLDELSIFF
jgi:hypothetical protein